MKLSTIILFGGIVFCVATYPAQSTAVAKTIWGFIVAGAGIGYVKFLGLI